MPFENLSFDTKLWMKRSFAAGVQTMLRARARISGAAARVRRAAERYGLQVKQDEGTSGGDAVAIPRLQLADVLHLRRSIDEKHRSPKAAEPLCSIILLVYNKAEYTFQCLSSLLNEVDLSTIEIVVVDNASTDATAEMLSCLDGLIRIIRNDENLGFVGGCNVGAAAAAGKYLLFLNNDTVVLPGWLDALLATPERDDTVGVVGPMYLYPNGLVQEAGGIVWRDGSTAHYGWGWSPDDRRITFAREVDHVSGASLLVRRDLFEKVGRFDERYAPGYYEDTDLCLSVRSLGYRVIYQPASRIVHFEGVTSGTDMSSGMKRYQAINRGKFHDKWRDVLDREHLAEKPENVVVASNRNRRPIILVFDERMPTPDRDAGSLRLVRILEMLTRWSRPIFVPIFGTPAVGDERLLGQMGVETRPVIDLPELLRLDLHTVILSRPRVASLLLGRARRARSRPRIIFDPVDAHFVRLRREAEVTGDRSLLSEAAVLERKELAASARSEVVWAASSTDADAIRVKLPDVNIVVVPTIHAGRTGDVPLADRRGLLFIGNMNHRPNLDGVRFLIKEVMPRVRERLPDVVLTIVGEGAAAELQELEGDGIVFVGYVPDVARVLDSARVFVAPLRFGAGAKGKVGEAMAAGLPVVTTTIGSEGMGISNAVEAMIEDDPDVFAQAVVRLYTNDVLWSAVAEKAHAHILRTSSPEAVERIVKASIFGDTRQIEPIESRLTDRTAN